MFGLYYLNVHIGLEGTHHMILEQVDDDHLQCLETLGEPLPILEWDGWWTPDHYDLVHVANQIDQQSQAIVGEESHLSLEWQRIGKDITFW